MHDRFVGDKYSCDADTLYYNSSSFFGSNMPSLSTIGYSHRFNQNTQQDIGPQLRPQPKARNLVTPLEFCNYPLRE